MTALKVLFIGGSGQISSACSQRAVDLGLDLYVLNRGRTSIRPLPDAAHRAAGRHPRPGLGPRRDRRARVRRRRRLGRLHARARAGRHRPLRRAHGAVRLHQLGVGLPDARRRGCRSSSPRRCATRLALLAGEDRVRGAAGPRLSRGRLPGDDRAALAHLRPHQRCPSRAAGRSSSACARARRSSSTATAPRCGRSPTTSTSPRRSSGCSAIRRRSATASTSPPTRC